MLQLRPRTIVFFLGLICIVHGCLSLFHVLETRREELEKEVKDARVQLNDKLAGGHFSKKEETEFSEDLQENPRDSGTNPSTSLEVGTTTDGASLENGEKGNPTAESEIVPRTSASPDEPLLSAPSAIVEGFTFEVRWTLGAIALLAILMLYRLMFGTGKRKKIAGIIGALILLSLAYVIFAFLIQHLPDGAEKFYRSNSENSSKMFRAFFLITAGSSISLLSVLWNIQTASQNWLQSVGFAAKGVGALIVVLIGYYYQINSDINKHRDSLAKYEQQTAALDQKRKEDRLEFLRSIAVSLGEAKTLSAKGTLLASLSPMIQDAERMSIAALQMVHHLAIYEEEEAIKNLAKKYLIPDLDLINYPEGEPLFANALILAFNRDTSNRLSISKPPYSSYYKYFEKEGGEYFGVTEELKRIEGAVRIPEEKKAVWKEGKGGNELPKELTSIAMVAASSEEKYGRGDKTSVGATKALENSSISKAVLEEAVRMLPQKAQRELRPRLLVFVPGTEEDYRGWNKIQSRTQEAIKQRISGDAELEKFIIMQPMLISQTGAKPPERNQVRYYLHRNDREADAKIRGRGILIEEALEAISTKDGKTEVDFQRYGGDPSETDLEFEGVFSQFEVWFSTRDEVVRFGESLGVDLDEIAKEHAESIAEEEDIETVPLEEDNSPAATDPSADTENETNGNNQDGSDESVPSVPEVPAVPPADASSPPEEIDAEEN